MQSPKLSIGFAALLAIFAVIMLMTATRAAAQTEKVLHSFNPNSMGAVYPATGLIFDAAGNLYGTTADGDCKGTKGGTVFELTPRPDAARSRGRSLPGGRLPIIALLVT
jgi:hypothetical protein